MAGNRGRMGGGGGEAEVSSGDEGKENRDANRTPMPPLTHRHRAPLAETHTNAGSHERPGLRGSRAQLARATQVQGSGEGSLGAAGAQPMEATERAGEEGASGEGAKADEGEARPGVAGRQAGVAASPPHGRKKRPDQRMSPALRGAAKAGPGGALRAEYGDGDYFGADGDDENDDGLNRNMNTDLTPTNPYRQPVDMPIPDARIQPGQDTPMRGGSLRGTMHDARPTGAHGTGHARPTLRGGHTAMHDRAAATAAAGPQHRAAIGVGDEASAAMEADDRATPTAAEATAGPQHRADIGVGDEVSAATAADERAASAAAGATAELQHPAAMEADDRATPAAAEEAARRERPAEWASMSRNQRRNHRNRWD